MQEGGKSERGERKRKRSDVGREEEAGVVALCRPFTDDDGQTKMG